MEIMSLLRRWVAILWVFVSVFHDLDKLAHLLVAGCFVVLGEWWLLYPTEGGLMGGVRLWFFIGFVIVAKFKESTKLVVGSGPGAFVFAMGEWPEAVTVGPIHIKLFNNLLDSIIEIA